MESVIITPPPPSQAIELLESAGYSAYVVGGCVRDSLLGNPPTDWDIATNAVPEEIISVFTGFRVIPTGLRHGTVTVIINGYHLEVTTFRVDGDYSDNRRPDSVTFVNNIEADLSRRDFTINAMAWNPREGLLDPFGGKNDLANKIIRSVGSPETRFREDALRILRGARFASALGFAIDNSTRGAMLRLCHLLGNIARERIAAELSKALMGSGFASVLLDIPELLFQIIPELIPSLGFNQRHPAHLYDVLSHTLYSVDAAPAVLPVRLALLFHDIAKPHCFILSDEGIGRFKGHPEKGAEITYAVLTRLRYDIATIQRVRDLVYWHNIPIPTEPRFVKRWLGRIGEDGFRQLLEVKKADNSAKTPSFGQIRLKSIQRAEEVMFRVLEEGQCFSLADLALSGKDLLAAGYSPGPELGLELKRLLTLVIDGVCQNNRDVLLKAMCPPQPEV